MERTLTTAAVLSFLLLPGCEFVGPPPSLTAVSPALLCDEAGPVELSLTGSGFGTTVGGVATKEPSLLVPLVSLRRVGDPAGQEDGDELSIDLGPERVRQTAPGTLVLLIDPSLGLRGGTYDVRVVNPDGQEATLPAALVATDPPVVDSLEPAEVCSESAVNEVALVGSGFITFEGALPTATVGEIEVPVLGLEDCLPLAAGLDGEICGRALVEVDGTAYALGDQAVALLNPAPAACASAGAPSLEVVLPPTLSAVEPLRVCSDGGEITVRGEHFSSSTEVSVGGVPASSITFVDENTLLVNLGDGTPTGMQDVAVGMAGACEDTLTAVLEVLSAPDVVFVDPPVTTPALSVSVTVYVADISSTIESVWIEDSLGARTEIPFVWDEAAPATLKASVPAGLAAGAYTVGIEQDDGCGNGLENGLTVREDLTVSVERLEPAYAWTFNHTAVEIVATDPAPGGMESLQDTPFVYLAPRDGGEGTAVNAVTWKGGGSATAVVPAGLAVGLYDVLVINPDGAVGLLEGGLEVTAEPPPTVDSVSPPSLENNGDGKITISGEDFRNPVVTLDCVEGGVSSSPTVTVGAKSETSIQATVDMGSLSAAICQVHVENSDGTSVRWAAISIRNPSQNLFPWTTGPDLVVARRAPVAAAGRTTSVDRYVYAIGGDSGSESSPLASVEYAAIDPWGQLGDFALLPSELPAARTLAVAARVRDFVYVIGGDEGSGPVATGWRAQILDPLEVPHLDALGVDTDPDLGVGGGTWVYRIAAIYPASDKMNPGGEGLPSEPIRIRLPADGDLYQVSVTWTEVDGASGYRIYRSPVADSGSGTEEWVTDVTGLTWIDTGVTTDSSRTPLPPGALGEWAALPTMKAARAGACIAVAEDPSLDPERVFLYVAGGEGSTGSDLSSVERLDVTIEAPGLISESKWVDAGITLSKARRQCGGYAADNSLHPSLADGDVWIWFAGGISGSKATGVVDAGLVLDGGAVGAFGEIDGGMTPARAGFGSAAASDFLYAFGGKNGSADAGGVSAELEPTQVPEVQNWNSLGISMSEPRYLPGSAQESAVIVILGGDTGTTSATTSTDWTNW